MVRQAISYEYQSYCFHKHLLANLWARPGPDDERPVDFTLRAGLAKSAVVVAVAIIEAALLDHGIARGYLPWLREEKRTIGKVLKAWSADGEGSNEKLENLAPRDQVKSVWEGLVNLARHRHALHIHRATDDIRSYYQGVIEREEQLLQQADSVIRFLQKLRPP